MVSVNQQTVMFLLSCVVGAGLGLLYDIFRILRIAVKTNKIIVFIEDVMFFVISMIVSFTFIIVQNSGVFRGILLIGEALGGVIYFFSISIIVMGSANIIINAVKWTFKAICKIFLLPFLKIYERIKCYYKIKIVQNSMSKILKEETD